MFIFLFVFFFFVFIRALAQHLGAMLNGRNGVKIFFPLCGKAVDMKWYFDK